jgi:hypothetical protein
MVHGGLLLRSSLSHNATSAANGPLDVVAAYAMTSLPVAGALVWFGPALLAAQGALWWQAVLFACAAVSGTLREIATESNFWSHEILGCLYYADVCCTCLALVQVALLILGPEDPCLLQLLHRRRLQSETDPFKVHSMTDIHIASRALPVVTLLAGLYGQSHSPADEGKLWTLGAQLANANAMFAFVAFWLTWRCPLRSELAGAVLLRRRFWVRAWKFLVCPLAALMGMGVALSMEGVPSCLVAAFLRGMPAALSAVVLSVVWDCGGDGKLVESSFAKNPRASGMLLCGMPAVLLPILATTLALDWRNHNGHFRWPTLSMTAKNPECKSVLFLGSPLLCVSAILAFWLIEECRGAEALRWASADIWINKPAGPAEFVKTTKMRRLGCRLGYLSILLGLLTACIVEGTALSDRVHTVFSVLFFASFLGSVMLTLVGAPRGYNAPLGRLRVALAAAFALDMIVLLVLFVVVNQYVPNHLITSHGHAYYALAEYAGILLLACWPLSWMYDV